MDSITKWTKYTVDAVCSGCSGIVVYGGGDIVFDSKSSNQWMQWTQYTVCSGHSRIVVYGGGDICLWYKKVKPVHVLDAVHNRHTTIYHYSTASTVSTAYSIPYVN